MPLVLVPRPAPDGPLSIDLDGILPSRVAALPATDVARLPIHADGRRLSLGDLFDVSGDAGDAVIECRGDWSRVHRVGAGLDGGRILIRGSVGRHAGERMTGGRLVIEGDAGDWLGAEMSGGGIRVAGSAGDNLVGGPAGAEAGMRGGLVIVSGAAGHLAAARMRRGLLVIGGTCGSAAGFEMRGGLLVLAGHVGPHAGLGMRRGTIVALGAGPVPPATFARGVAWEPPLIPLLFHRLKRAGFDPGHRSPSGSWRQWHGDLLAGGRGELWHRDP